MSASADLPDEASLDGEERAATEEARADAEGGLLSGITDRLTGRSSDDGAADRVENEGERGESDPGLSKRLVTGAANALGADDAEKRTGMLLGGAVSAPVMAPLGLAYHMGRDAKDVAAAVAGRGEAETSQVGRVSLALGGAAVGFGAVATGGAAALPAATAMAAYAPGYLGPKIADRIEEFEEGFRNPGDVEYDAPDGESDGVEPERQQRSDVAREPSRTPGDPDREVGNLLGVWDEQDREWGVEGPSVEKGWRENPGGVWDDESPEQSPAESPQEGPTLPLNEADSFGEAFDQVKEELEAQRAGGRDAVDNSNSVG